MDLDQQTSGDIGAAFGAALQRERVRRGWTAEEAAHKAGISPKTWQRLEDGKPARSLTLARVDEVFGLPHGTAERVWKERIDLAEEFEKARIADESGTSLRKNHPPFPRDWKELPDDLIERVSELDGKELNALRCVVEAAITLDNAPGYDQATDFNRVIEQHRRADEAVAAAEHQLIEALRIHAPEETVQHLKEQYRSAVEHYVMTGIYNSDAVKTVMNVERAEAMGLHRKARTAEQSSDGQR